MGKLSVLCLWNAVNVHVNIQGVARGINASEGPFPKTSVHVFPRFGVTFFSHFLLCAY